MATAIMRPNGTVTVQWTVTNAATAHEALDDAVTQPSAGSEADGYVSASTNNSTIDLDLTAPADVDTGTALTVWVEASNSGGGDEDILIEIRDAVATVLASTTVKPAVSAYGWHSLTLGSQSWTQTQVNGLRLAFTSKKVGGGAQTEMRVRAAYGDLTYTAGGAPATVTPAAIVSTVAVPAGSLSAGSTVTPAVVASPVSVPAAGLSTGSTVAPSVMPVVAGLPQATAVTPAPQVVVSATFRMAPP